MRWHMSEAMMRCTHCDDQMPADAEFCIECGMRAPAYSSAGASTRRIPAPAQAERRPPSAEHMPSAYPLQAYPLPAASPPAQTNIVALISLIFGILGWVGLPLFGAIIAVIAGHYARRTSHNRQHPAGGDQQAMIGLILGYAHLALLLALAVAYVLAHSMSFMYGGALFK